MRRWFALGVICLVAMIGAASQGLFSILLESVKADFALTDTEIGLINGLAIAVVGTIAAYPIGMAADRYGRRLVLGLSVITWSAATMLMALAETKTLFTIGAVGINLGDAALIPLLYALVPTIFAGNERNRTIANAVLVTVLIIGSYTIYWLSGHALNALEASRWLGLTPWRLLALGVAGAGGVITLALLVLPGKAPAAPAAPPALVQPNLQIDGGNVAFLGFLRQHGLTILLLYIGVSFFYVAWTSGILFWGPAILQRSYGLSAAAANIMLGSLTFASAAGLGAAFVLIARFGKAWGAAAPVRLMILGCIFGLLPAAYMPFAPTADAFLYALMAFSFCMTIPMAMAPALLQNCAPNRFRSQTIALFPIVVLWMRIAMPWGIGALSDRMADVPHALLYINAGLLLVSLPPSIVILWLMLPRYRTLVEDVQREDRRAV